MVKREAIVFMAIAILSVMGLANSDADDESCDADNDGCVEWEIKELNEIVKTIESRSNNAISENDIDLIKKLKHIKNKLQTERWIERWNDDELRHSEFKNSGQSRKFNREQTMLPQMLETYAIVNQMVKNNDCSIVTRVSRTFLRLVGKHFQANCDKDNMKHRDSNDNDCDWYGDGQNAQECGEHDVPPYFIANKMCCACKEAPDATKTFRLLFAWKIIECYFLEEKIEDANDSMQGALDILDEFVEAFGKNADNNINIIVDKMYLLQRCGASASEYQTSLDFLDLALNIHSRYLGDDKKSYADILLFKASKILGKATKIPSKREEAFELLNKCLEIFSGDEENSKQQIEQIHGYFALFGILDGTTSTNDAIINGKKKLKLEKEMHGEIRRDKLNGINNYKTLIDTGTQICSEYIGTRKLKKIDYDEATGYLLEALAIAESHPDYPLLAVNNYYALSICEYVKEGERNLRKVVDYLERSLLLISKMDETDRHFRKAQNSIKETIDQLEVLMKIVTQEIIVYDFDDELNGINNYRNLINLGAEICTKYNEPGKLKQIDYDEARGYLLEALAIADFHPDKPLIAARNYVFLSICEYVKEGKRNLGKALDYLERGLLLISKMDETDSEFIEGPMSKKATIDQFEELLEVITQEKTVYDFYDI